MQRLFLIAWSAVVILAIGLVSYLWVSLIPFFHQIGVAMTILLITCLACAGCLAVAFTYSRIGIMLANRERAIHHRRVITSGDVVVYLDANGAFTHLSAMHEQAKIQPPATIVNALPAPTTSDETILELFNRGSTLTTICEATGEKYNRVQKVTSDYKKRHAAE